MAVLVVAAVAAMALCSCWLRCNQQELHQLYLGLAMGERYQRHPTHPIVMEDAEGRLNYVGRCIDLLNGYVPPWYTYDE